MNTCYKFVFGLLLLAAAAFSHLQAASLNVLYNFTPSNDGGINPVAALVQGSDGNFYGTTQNGGNNNDGIVFMVTPAGVLTTLVSFNGTNGSLPAAALLQGSDGNFYGTTSRGGSSGNGTVFMITPAGVLTTLASFNGTNGSLPIAALVQGSDGNFYGTTNGGGSSDDGTVFMMTPTGVLTTLASFDGANGSDPHAGLVQGSDGNFYGTTEIGGSTNNGTVFMMTPAGVLTTLVSFDGANGSDPQASLMQGSDGNFYGTTEIGGSTNNGTVFMMTPAGVLTTLVSFDGANGSGSVASLAQGSDGNFYGTTQGDGSASSGTIFMMTPAGALMNLASFNATDVAFPEAGLVQGSDGNFYGTTMNGGSASQGMVFQLIVSSNAAAPIFSPPAGNYTSAQTVAITSATSGASIRYTTDGSTPSETNGTIYSGPLYLSNNATLSAIAYASGFSDSPVSTAIYTVNFQQAAVPVFSLGAGTYTSAQIVTISTATSGASIRYTTDGSMPTETTGIIYDGTPVNVTGTTILKAVAYESGFVDSAPTSSIYAIISSPVAGLNVLYNFTSFNNGGINPYAGLVEGHDGNFYGTTFAGGNGNNGTIFTLTPFGILYNLLSFDYPRTGAEPYASLVQGSDGSFYGTTVLGNSGGNGTIFKITPASAYSLLDIISGAQGSNPYGSLVQGRDGNFYGTTTTGGSSSAGTVFKITPTGVLTTLVSFNGANGVSPYAGLIQGSDGNFYGTTAGGGSGNNGTVFKVTPFGVLTTLALFNGANGGSPDGALVQGSDGNFYGTTRIGGNANDGTVFKMTPAGVLTALVSFTGANGGQPYAGLVQGSDGNFYGTTQIGGTSNVGTVFKITSAGVLTTLVSFDGVNGANPYASLVQGSDGNFYGTTYGGGSFNDGVIFQLIVPPAATAPVFSPAASTYTSAQTVTITSATSGAAIRYTTDGSTPTETNGTIYTGAPINISTTTTLQAIAYEGGIADSSVASGLYAIIQPQVSTPTFTPPAGTYTSAQTVTITSATGGATIRYTTDGSTPTKTFGTIYSGPLNISSRTVLQAIAYAPGFIDSARIIGTYTISPPRVATPVFSPASDTYPSAQTVAITSTTPGATIRYTTDSSTPTETNGTLYSGPVSISATTDLQAIAYENGFLDSPVAGGNYWIVPPAPNLNVLYNFTGSNNVGSNPQGALIQGTDGNFYGTTVAGGSANNGTIFQLTPAGILTTLVSFTGTNGANPEAALVQGSDGNFYGTTETGGSSNFGTAFRMTPAGILTTLVSFTGPNGQFPHAGIVQGSDGNFYGTTFGGGSSNNGTVFQMTPTGVLTTLVSFNIANGQWPTARLVQGSDGNFYGTTSGGGGSNDGTVFKITPAGVLTTLVSFTGTNGALPYAGLAQGTDGNFYGTTSNGGSDSSNGGTIFKMTPAGALTTLASFTDFSGFSAISELVQGPDGSFYGTAESGGSGIDGTVFKLTPAGVLSPLVSFDNANGNAPTAALIPGLDGNFYGTTLMGGTFHDGVIFQLIIPPALAPAFSPVGGTYTSTQSVTITCPGATAIYYTTDGTVPTTSSALYTTPVPIVSNTVLQALGVNSGGPSPVASASFTLLLQAAAPVFNPAASTYTSTQAVTITSDTSGASIQYTTDGSTPTGTNGTLYSGPVSITSTTMLKAIASESGFADSPVTSGLYTITHSPASSLDVLFDLAASNNAGVNPYGSLVQGRDGNFYGTTTGGGSGGNGTVFQLTPDGVLTTLVSFNGDNGANPVASLVQGNDGNFYGTTTGGGSGGNGTVFQLTPDGVLTTLVSFNGDNGANPVASLVQGSDGNFYGTTVNGGNGGNGTVFQLTPDGVLTTLVSFNGDNGANPFGGLVQGNDGNFYGTTYFGGNGGNGTVFQLTPAGVLTVLTSFSVRNGANPYASLFQDSNGSFYGTTVNGGSANNGVVFKITPAGILTALVSFDGANGFNPYGPLVQDRNGNFYGTTKYGGSANDGTVFQMTPTGGLTTLLSFDGSNGANPIAGLSQDSSGNFYGSTTGGGASNVGVIFQVIVPPQVAPPTFSPDSGTYNNAQAVAISTITSNATIRYTTDGSTPTETNGTIYAGAPVNIGTTTVLQAIAYESSFINSGVTSATYVINLPPAAAPVFSPAAGTYTNAQKVTIKSPLGGASIRYTTDGSTPTEANGTLYSGPVNLGRTTMLKAIASKSGFADSPVTSGLYLINSSPAASLNVLYDFAASNNAGINPTAALVQGGDGSFYGTTSSGGSGGYGTIFQLTPAGVVTTLVAFNFDNGAFPVAALVPGRDGNFYGTTSGGGSGGNGTVFQLTPAGVLTTLVAFSGDNGSDPNALVQGSDGNFYGTTAGGGSGGNGTVFQLTPAGVLTTLVSFNGANGAQPNAAVVQGSDGNFYGTTYLGGSSNVGTVFQLTPTGILTTLVSFNYDNGASPLSGLVQGSDGNFYGTTSSGGSGSGSNGTVFMLTPAGVLTTLVSFNGTNGSFPITTMIQGSDGSFYGTTTDGGSTNAGTIFKLTPTGVLTTLVSLDGPNGASPEAGLVQGGDGSLYGLTYGGGVSGAGVIFQLILPPQVTAPVFSPGSGTYNNAQTVTISTPTSGATIRYTTDGSAPTKTHGTIYSKPVSISTTTTLQAIAYKTGFTDSPVTTATYTIQAAAPVFSPAGGTYIHAQMVTITSATSGASIRYTTDGSAPTKTHGTVYSKAVSITATTTLQAITYKTGFIDSPVTSATYTITPPPTLNFEAESLSYTPNGAIASIQTDTNSSNGKWVELAGNSTGDYITFTVPNVPAGTYQLKMEWKGNNTRGILQLSVDGSNLGSTLDQYASGQTYPTTTFGNVTFNSAGNHTIRLTVTGKNKSSSAYQLSADKFTLVGQ
ncbi:MAG TPA: choice-of-anchor tandem repeat GloVer-containing protein [Opitutaceae bacterium]|nr:choice-of-anchor tandem repeat GloVer-containing protein [Opitutaceae bacterium]